MTVPRHAPLRRSALLALALLLASAPTTLAQSVASPYIVAASGTPAQPAPARLEHATANAAVATRASVAPVLDGRTDDAAWANAQVIDQFLQYEPNEGQESRFRTEARVTFDDRYLYVLARMYDPAPDSIVSLLSRRDVRTASEQIKLIVDSYNDKKTGYEFIVNPAGVKRDFSVSGDNNEDASWDVSGTSRRGSIRSVGSPSSGSPSARSASRRARSIPSAS